MGINIIQDLAQGAAKGLFSGVGAMAKNIREAITGKGILDPNKQAEVEQQLMELQFAATKAQTDINLAEAKNPNLFVAGWRPAVGWVCVLGLGYDFLLRPLLPWAVGLFHQAVPVLPALDMGSLLTLLGGLLGLGGMRTVEKLQGAAGNH